MGTWNKQRNRAGWSRRKRGLSGSSCSCFYSPGFCTMVTMEYRILPQWISVTKWSTCKKLQMSDSDRPSSAVWSLLSWWVLAPPPEDETKKWTGAASTFNQSTSLLGQLLQVSVPHLPMPQGLEAQETRPRAETRPWSGTEMGRPSGVHKHGWSSRTVIPNFLPIIVKSSALRYTLFHHYEGIMWHMYSFCSLK